MTTYKFTSDRPRSVTLILNPGDEITISHPKAIAVATRHRLFEEQEVIQTIEADIEPPKRARKPASKKINEEVDDGSN